MDTDNHRFPKRTGHENPKPKRLKRNATAISFSFDPGKEFFPQITPHLRPALMDNLFPIYRRTL